MSLERMAISKQAELMFTLEMENIKDLMILKNVLEHIWLQFGVEITVKLNPNGYY